MMFCQLIFCQFCTIVRATAFEKACSNNRSMTLKEKQGHQKLCYAKGLMLLLVSDL